MTLPLRSRFRSRSPSRVLGLLAATLLACPARREEGSPRASAPDEPQALVTTPSSADDAREDRESAHHVVFSDRTSQSYLLLLEGDLPVAPTREELASMVRERLPGSDNEPEVELLLDFIAHEPAPVVGAPGLDSERSESIRHRDLLGLHIASLPLAPVGEEALVPLEVLRDPVSTRALSDAERESLPRRRYVLVLRGHYRNRYGVRGLRLLQTLVRIVSLELGGLVHDPDTGETMGLDVFTARRLQSTVGNVADQVVVMPFPDPRHGEGFVRLSTRGMRRFGSVDLELDGLPRDARALEAATHLIYGVAYRMVIDGEYDRGGYAVEVDEIVELSYLDVSRAYAGREGRVSRCKNCPQQVDLHLVERSAESHDPVEHVVARIVAPRSVSDEGSYDHPAWVRSALHDLLGVP